MAIFSSSYKYPLLASILARPVVDATWNYRYDDFNLIYILNGMFVLIFFYRLLFRKDKIYQFPYSRLLGVYLFVIVFISFNILVKSGFLIALEFFFKSALMPMSFYLFYHYFSDWESGKQLTKALIIAGLFPIFSVFAQLLTGNIGRFRPSRGFVRLAGFYHDNVSTRSYLMLALIGIFLYWHYYLKDKDKKSKAILMILFILILFGLYYQYSKAIIIIAIIWISLFLMHLTYKRRANIAYLLPILLTLGFLINSSFIIRDIEQIFDKEIDLVSGRTRNWNILAGRIPMWERFMNEWREAPLLEKIFGLGKIERGFHNDYIRVLFSGGIMFLCFSFFVTVIFLLKILLSYSKEKTFIHFVALILFIYFSVESIGATPGVYPHMQVVVWGIIGLSINNQFCWKEVR